MADDEKCLTDGAPVSNIDDKQGSAAAQVMSHLQLPEKDVRLLHNYSSKCGGIIYTLKAHAGTKARISSLLRIPETARLDGTACIILGCKLSCQEGGVYIRYGSYGCMIEMQGVSCTATAMNMYVWQDLSYCAHEYEGL